MPSSNHVPNIVVQEIPTHLPNGGVSIVIALDAFGAPTIAHWGQALADADIPGLLATSTPSTMNSSLDIPRSFSILAGLAAHRHQVADPAWLADDLTVTGAVLAQGLPLPVLNPGNALLLHFTAV